ncbi:MAG: hypothetical protein WCA63_04475 [Gallionella sp.]
MSYWLIARKGYRGLAAKALALPYVQRVILAIQDFAQMQMLMEYFAAAYMDYMQAGDFFATHLLK